MNGSTINLIVPVSDTIALAPSAALDYMEKMGFGLKKVIEEALYPIASTAVTGYNPDYAMELIRRQEYQQVYQQIGGTIYPRLSQEEAMSIYLNTIMFFYNRLYKYFAPYIRPLGVPQVGAMVEIRRWHVLDDSFFLEVGFDWLPF